MKFRTKEIELKHDKLSFTNRYVFSTWMVYPRYIQLNTHNFCNLRCVYCNVKEESKEYIKREVMKKKIFYDLIDKINPQNRWVEGIALFMNGEPLLDKRLNSFYDYLMDYSYYGIVDSNATITHNINQLIHPFIGVIRISLSAHNEDLYEKIHGYNLFNKVIDNLYYIRDNKEEYQYLQINHMICKDNYKYVGDFKREFKDFNITLFPLHDGLTQNSSKKSSIPDEDKNIDENITLFNNGKIRRNWNVSKRYKLCQCWDLLGIGLHGEIMHCVDEEEKFNYGTIYNTSIKRAWKERIDNKRYPNICNSCNLLFSKMNNN